MGIKFSEEHRKKISEARKGQPSWNKGKKLSVEHRRKIGKAHKGKKLSEEHKRKLSETHKGKLNLKLRGRRFSEEHKKRLSEAKRGKYTGKNNPNWKGGITSENHRARTSLEIKLWKQAILKRDNFICQKCGQYGGELHIHHINNFAEFPELRTVIGNGIILCEECHKKFHQIYGEYNNTKEQLQEFLIT